MESPRGCVKSARSRHCYPGLPLRIYRPRGGSGSLDRGEPSSILVAPSFTRPPGAELRSFTGVTLVLLLAAAGCRVERTPERYFDHQTTIEAEREAAAAEIRDRLLAMGQALGRGNSTEALIALSPAPDVYLVGPEEGMVVRGSDLLESTLGGLMESQELAAEVRDVEVGIAPRANVGWFRAELLLPGRTPDGKPLRMTGVYLRDAGIWKLVQAHVSLPFTPPPPDSTSSRRASASDSAGAAGAR